MNKSKIAFKNKQNVKEIQNCKSRSKPQKCPRGGFGIEQPHNRD